MDPAATILYQHAAPVGFIAFFVPPLRYLPRGGAIVLQRAKSPPQKDRRTCPWERGDAVRTLFARPLLSSSSFSSRNASGGSRRQDAAGQDSGSAPVKGAAGIPFFRGDLTSLGPEQPLFLLLLLLLHHPDAGAFATSLREESLAITLRSRAVFDRRSLTLQESVVDRLQRDSTVIWKTVTS